MESVKTKTLRSFGRGTVFPHQWSWMFELPGRSLILSPRAHALRLPLEPTYRVLELGCGSGYYSAEVARRLPRGHLELFDVQQPMLDKARRRMTRLGFENVGFTLGHARNLPFPDQSFELLYMVTVFGEVDDKPAFVRAAQRVLKPGGILSISEHHPDPDWEAPEAVMAEVEPAGFVHLQTIGWRWSFTLNFKRA